MQNDNIYFTVKKRTEASNDRKARVFKPKRVAQKRLNPEERKLAAVERKREILKEAREPIYPFDIAAQPAPAIPIKRAQPLAAQQPVKVVQEIIKEVPKPAPEPAPQAPQRRLTKRGLTYEQIKNGVEEGRIIAPHLKKMLKEEGLSAPNGETVKAKLDKLKAHLEPQGKGFIFRDAVHAKMHGGALGHAIVQKVANKMITALRKHDPQNPAIAKFKKLKQDSMNAVKAGGLHDDFKKWFGKKILNHTIGAWWRHHFPAKPALGRGGKLKGGSFTSMFNNFSNGLFKGLTLGLVDI